MLSFGLDQALGEPGLLPGRVGLVTNDAARCALDTRLHSRVALQRAGIRLVRLFSPEHGINTAAADGAAVNDSVDKLTGLPVVSLYGERQRPASEHFADLDAVVFDIPDIGSRFYTYIWTLWHVLGACGETGKPLIILDRPNPLGGDLAAAEGPVLDTTRCASFLGQASIPIRHSLTVGELARLWNTERKSAADLRVVRCEGWQRSMHWPDTSLPFVQTSPALPSYSAALLYPGVCLFEATNLSVGRGTDTPFQTIAAPWLKSEETAARFNALTLPGLVAEPRRLAPKESRYAGENCAAVYLRAAEAKQVRPVATGLCLLATVLALHPKDFRWATYPTAANPTGTGHFERLIGRLGVRESLQAAPENVAQRVSEWTAAAGWRARVESVLLYE